MKNNETEALESLGGGCYPVWRRGVVERESKVREREELRGGRQRQQEQEEVTREKEEEEEMEEEEEEEEKEREV